MLFEDQTTGQNTGQATQTQTTEDWLAKVVEVKGKAFEDVNTLAKSKLEADAHIKNLEAQIAELKTRQTQEDYTKELLNQLRDKGATSTTASTAAPNQNIGGTKPSDTKLEPSEETLEALVNKTLTKREQDNTAKQNRTIVEQELVSRYGTEAKAFVAKKAQELGLSEARLTQLAEESPTAFMALLGEPKREFKPLVNGSINTQNPVYNQQAGVKNKSYFDAIRRKDKALFNSFQVQNEMMKARMELGDRFNA